MLFDKVTYGDIMAERRAWQAREMRLVVEYLARNYPKYETRTRVRLGGVPKALDHPDLSEGERRALGVWRRWADAIVIMPTKLVLIEAKIRPGPEAIAQLELYKHLLPKTPELQPHKAKPIELVLLFALEDPVVEQLARAKGIRVVYFKPKWVDEYLSVLYPRERRAPLTDIGQEE